MSGIEAKQRFALKEQGRSDQIRPWQSSAVLERVCVSELCF